MVHYSSDLRSRVLTFVALGHTPLEASITFSVGESTVIRWRRLFKLTGQVAAIREEAMLAPCVFKGAMTGEMFKTYLETFLIKELKPNDCVIMDNLPAHK